MCATHCAQAEVRQKEASVILLTSTLCMKAVTKSEIRPNFCKSDTISQLFCFAKRCKKIEPCFRLAISPLTGAIGNPSLHSLLNNMYLLKKCQLFRVPAEQPAHLTDFKELYFKPRVRWADLHDFFCHMNCCSGVHCQWPTSKRGMPFGQCHKNDQLK